MLECSLCEFFPFPGEGKNILRFQMHRNRTKASHNSIAVNHLALAKATWLSLLKDQELLAVVQSPIHSLLTSLGEIYKLFFHPRLD